MTKHRLIVSILASAIAVAAVSPAVAQAGPTPRQEWAAHPNLVRAVQACEGALADLQRAPDDFGGNKARAISDLRAAIHSLRKSIFYRTRMDDAAIDRTSF